MEMTLSRKFLNVAGILDYIFGSLTLLLSFLVAGAGIYVLDNPGLANALPTDFGHYTVLVVGIGLAAGAVFTLFFGHLERAAAKDPARVMPVWVLSILSVVLGAGSIILNLVHQVAIADLAFNFVGLAISILVLAAANNIKKEAGK